MKKEQAKAAAAKAANGNSKQEKKDAVKPKAKNDVKEWTSEKLAKEAFAVVSNPNNSSSRRLFKLLCELDARNVKAIKAVQLMVKHEKTNEELKAKGE